MLRLVKWWLKLMILIFSLAIINLIVLMILLYHILTGSLERRYYEFPRQNFGIQSDNFNAFGHDCWLPTRNFRNFEIKGDDL